MTIFFSATAMSALSIIVAMLADNSADVLAALGIVQPAAPLERAQVRRLGPVRATTVRTPASPLRAAA